ncbi:MAG TPA: multicopper oxidase domain-containing protein [Thermomicrobiales bacterium]|jgi:manganese oxidase|nr:multicopper oxidase domain-containing protein [Thermomicrobiales bacterium]
MSPELAPKTTPITPAPERHRTDVSRRRLMAMAGLGGVGALATTVSAALTPRFASAEGTPSSDHDGMDMGTPTATAEPTVEVPTDPNAPMTWQQMDAMHEAGIKAFPAYTSGHGNQPLQHTMDGDVKVFDLTAKIINWEYEPGKTVLAWAYNEQVPGPEIRVTEGDRVRVNLTNLLTESTAIHWHGLIVPNDQDGVPFITQPIVPPGGKYTYEFTIREGNVGTHMYHSHANSAKQVPMGLLGAFIVEPKDPKTRPAFDLEYTLVLNDGALGGFTLNGKSFPATVPLTAKKGQKVMVRYMNEGQMIHPMHLHGMPQTIIAQDGWLLPQPYVCDTLNIAPGQRFEAIVDATEVGVWAFHCHILSHAESDHGMFGMVTALIVAE